MTPSTPAPTDAGTLAGAVLQHQRVFVSTGYKEGYFRCGHCYERGQGDDHTITHKPECPVLVAISVKTRNSAPQEPTVDEIAARSPGVSKATIRNLLDAELCDDCPPRGHPTDKTRCRVCPRVSSKDRAPRFPDAISPEPPENAQ